MNFAEPINPEVFEREIVERQHLLEDVLQDMSPFVSPPSVYLKINAMLTQGDYSAADFASVIRVDPNLTLRLLKLVNSSYYGLSTTIESVSRAISVIGMRELTNVVCSVAAVGAFSRISSNLTNMASFWQHSVYCAIASKHLATLVQVEDVEKMFVAGLLHDVGSLVINQRFPELVEKNIIEAAGNELAIVRTEQRWLGFDHASVAAVILDDWKFSAELCDAIRYHHTPRVAQLAPQQAAIIHIADRLADQAGIGVHFDSDDQHVDFDESALQVSGLADDFWTDGLAEEILEQYNEMKSLFA